MVIALNGMWIELLGIIGIPIVLYNVLDSDLSGDAQADAVVCSGILWIMAWVSHLFSIGLLSFN